MTTDVPSISPCVLRRYDGPAAAPQIQRMVIARQLLK
jgi:hypothetical protein